MEFVTVQACGKWPLQVPKYKTNIDHATWEKERMLAMAAAYKGGPMLEIGSEQGDLSAIVAQFVRPENMHLFEANDRSWSTAKLTWAKNGLAAPAGSWAGFVSDVTDLKGTAPVKGWPAVADNPDYLEECWFRCLHENPTAIANIPAITVDAYAVLSGAIPTMISMDVEGAELMVLKGAEQTLRSAKPVVFVSVHPEFMRERYGTPPALVSHYMLTLGYKETLIHVDHEEHRQFTPEGK
jgi:FkbM family methyltransferase